MKKTPIILAAMLLVATVLAQTSYSWVQIKDKFEAANPTLRAARLNIDESRAAEITANLRPNPTLTGTLDQINVFAPASSPTTGTSGYRPLQYAFHLLLLRIYTSATTNASCGWKARVRPQI
jgi:hypothetical protein